MGKYLSPSSLENIQTKCAIIFYPDDDGAFFLNAVRGQLSELARPFIWEGDRAKQDAIAQLFTVTDLMTDDVFFGLDCELIDLITGEEDMNINVNCGCCDGSSGTTLICYDNNGQPTINTDPYTPDDGYPSPTGDDWPMNPDTQPAPTGFDDWVEYDTNACAAANAYYELLVFLVAAAYGIVDLAVTLAATIVGVAALFPARVAEVLASPWIAKFAESLVKLATHSEDAKDWIAEVQNYLDDNQESIVCGLYSHRHDIPGMKVDLVNKIMAYMVSILTLDAGDLVVLRDWLDKAMPFDVLFSWYINAANWTLLTVTAVDCSGCLPGDTWEYDDEFTTNGGWMAPSSGNFGWRADNGGEVYSIGHTIDISRGLDRTSMLTRWGEVSADVEAWYIDQVTIDIMRNTAQAPDTEFYAVFNYRDGTQEVVARTGTTDGTVKSFQFVNPYPGKPLWDSQEAFVRGFDFVLPADPGASTWFEYFFRHSNATGSYQLGTYVDYGDMRP